MSDEPAETYSLVLTRGQLFIVLKAVQAACTLWTIMTQATAHDISSLLATLAKVEKD